MQPGTENHHYVVGCRHLDLCSSTYWRRRVWQFAGRYACTVIVLASYLRVVATVAQAQALGTITGTVMDPSGAGVPKAKVSATETEASFARSIVSDDSGHYALPSLRPTVYRRNYDGFRGGFLGASRGCGYANIDGSGRDPANCGVAD